jgi:hypothetical protein
MSSKQFVVIEVKDNKVIRMIKWTRNTEGELQYKITSPQRIERITNPTTVAKFWETLSVPHQFYDLKEKRFYANRLSLYAETE